MDGKVTWGMIFDDFKRRHPRLSKSVRQWKPWNYLTIVIDMTDGTRMLYDYYTHKAIFR